MKKLLILTAIIITFSSCGREQYSGIPIVPVNFSIDVFAFDQGELANMPGNYAMYREGYRGVMVYCTFVEQYAAYERTCTYKPETTCTQKLEVDETGSFLYCPDCGSQFMILSGGIPTKGSKATRRLLMYNTSYNALSHTVFVYN